MASKLEILKEAIEKDPTAIFKNVKKTDAKSRVEYLAEAELLQEKIDTIVNGTEFIDNKNFIGVLKNYKNLLNDDKLTTNFCNNLANIIKSACLSTKMDDIVKSIVNSKILDTSTIDTTFRNINEAQKYKFIRALFEKNSRESSKIELVKAIDKKTIVDFMIYNYKNKLAVGVVIGQEMLGFNNDELNSEVVKALTTTAIENSRALDTLDTLFGMAKPDYTNMIMSKLNDNQIEFLFTEMKKNGKDLSSYVAKMPEFVQERLVNKNQKLFSEAISNLKPTQKAQILGNIKDDQTLAKVYQTMDKKEQDAIIEALDDPSVQTVKDKIAKVTENATEVSKDYNKIRANIWSNRFSKVNKVYNKFAAKILEMRVELREDFLLKLGDLHTKEDRLGLIGRAQMAVYKRSADKYKELNDRLGKRRGNIKTIDQNIEKKLKENEEKKEDIKKRKAEMKKDSLVAQARKKNEATMKRLNSLTPQVEEKKEDKFGKFELPAERTRLAWGYILEAATPEKRVSAMKIDDIKTIITSNADTIGTMTEEELSYYTKKTYAKIQLLKMRKKGIDDEIEEEVAELAGIHMGMSNYTLIIAVTALTITGLIILLTMILS